MNINMSSVNINGISIEVRKGRVYVGGKLYGPVEGGGAGAPVEQEPAFTRLELDGDGKVVGDVHGDLVIRGVAAHPITLIIQGNVEGSVNSDGSVTCEKIGGSATAGGDIKTEKVGGSANAGGNVHAGKIGGSANAGGNILRG